MQIHAELETFLTTLKFVWFARFRVRLAKITPNNDRYGKLVGHYRADNGYYKFSKK
jgi:hypothetical protein